MDTDVLHAADRIGQMLADDRMAEPEMDHIPEKLIKGSVFFQKLPVKPGDLIVLTVAVVVSELGVGELIPGQEHGSAAAAHEDGAGIADHPEAQVQDLGINGVPFLTAQPAALDVGSVCIVPAVVFVVLLIVGVEIIHGEAVMAGQEIDAGVVACIVPLVI